MLIRARIADSAAVGRLKKITCCGWALFRKRLSSIINAIASFSRSVWSWKKNSRPKKEELLDTLEVGQIREGVVVRLVDFGAFVDLGGIDGLIDAELGPSIPPKSTNAPKSAKRTTTPSRICPTSKVSSNSCFLAWSSSSRPNAARERRDGVYDRGRSLSDEALADEFVEIADRLPRICDAGTNPRIPKSTSTPPLTTCVTVASITSSCSWASMTFSHVLRARARRSERKSVPSISSMR